MAAITSRKYSSKDGREFVVRHAVAADAAAVLELARAVAAEEIFHLTSAAEYKLSVEDEVKFIETHLEKELHLMLVAEAAGEIVGVLDFVNGHRLRIEHTGNFGMSVAQGFRGMGIGAALIGSLLEWAEATGKIEKIGLQVHSTNQAAQALYRKCGFEVEGVRKKDLKYGPGQYVDTVVMGRFI